MLLAKLYESRYRARWRGIILNSSDCVSHCFYYLILFDRHGNPVKQRLVKHLDPNWMIDTGELVDISHINPDWLALVKLMKA